MAERFQPVLLAFKEGVFHDDETKRDVSFYQVAVDHGNYLKVHSVKLQQLETFRLLEPGEVLPDHVVAGKYLVLI